ncbi:glucan endo-1,3-beta-glucosidase-like [Momordica charantia]|uniref:glucan endo-1,3-beta-D-glucosidase n=1 Tax=Momordica charantia TaxID=3673 RepID=A0A6J1DNI9_MOMCH|nr:glucan endo-1,3-beta-glucosidase-like [Momordica charantia]
MASSLFSTFCSLSLLLLGALISAGFRIIGSKSGNMAMAMAMAIDEVDSMALLPLGSVSGIGSFIRLPQCGGPRPTVETVQAVGVCYSSMGDNLPEPGEVVQLYKSYGIKRMRIYDTNKAILNALRGSNIEVVVGIPNNDLQRVVNLSSAESWVQRNIQAYIPHVNFRYVTIGNEVRPSDSFAGYVLPAMRNIYSAISAANLQDQMKVSTVISTVLLGASYPPSAGSFRSDAREFIEPIVSFLAKNGSPLLANLYPYYSYISNNRDITLDYALLYDYNFPTVVDGNLVYHNLLDATVDALYAALEKSGGANFSIVISESGWPSGAGTNTVVENEVAGTYYRNLIRHVQSGSPRRPGRAIETYLFSMFDENLRPSETEKHFGLFTHDMKQKYQLSVS